jgi:hypothetical protein
MGLSCEERAKKYSTVRRIVYPRRRIRGVANDGVVLSRGKVNGQGSLEATTCNTLYCTGGYCRRVSLRTVTGLAQW